MKIRINVGLPILFGIFLISSIILSPVFAQLPTMTSVGVKINTPSDSVNVPVGDLTIYGASSDNNSTNCQVYADWNDLKPMQVVTADGPNGDADYSEWSYTFNSDYHGIVEGPNELTSKITCYDQAQKLATSKSYSINVTGTTDGSEVVNNTDNQNTVSDSEEDTKVLPVKSSSSNNESSNDTVEKSTESTVSDSEEDTKVLPVKSSSSNNESSNDTVEKSTESTVSDSEEDTKVLPVKSSSSNNESSNDTVEKSTESTVSDSEEDTKVLPVKNILPLYSESNEESITSASTADDDETEVISTDKVELQDEPVTNETIDTDSETYTTISSEQHGQIGELNTIDMNESEAAEASNVGSTSYSDQNRDNDSIFGLKFNGLDDASKNSIEKKIEKLEDRIDDRVQLFDLIG
jgi:hypothetical protein